VRNRLPYCDDCTDRDDIPFFTHDYDGYLVVIEGLDGVGKTTLLDLLDMALKAKGSTVTRGRHPTAEALQLPMFRRYMYEPELRPALEYRALLATLLSDRLQHVAQAVRPALARGECVLMDRYIHTMIVMMRARGYEEDWLLEACRLFPKPDVAILLDVPLRTAITRVSARSDQFDSHVEEEFFLRIQEEYRWFGHRGSLICHRSDENSPEKLAAVVLDALSEVQHARGRRLTVQGAAGRSGPGA
jgi:dTMP kinase